MGLLSNRVERSEIRPGDHIYTWRAVYAYSHHGTRAPTPSILFLLGCHPGCLNCCRHSPMVAAAAVAGLGLGTNPAAALWLSSSGAASNFLVRLTSDQWLLT
ncbi:Os09g0526800 [Oryza sativa Japonica Group]|uniref:Os09g0526800 protein n=1 Tax=Oryza sativa subsp. japonica TaxID=39947 RepID=A0A0N7KR53_ORYSJ|nr:hypothetical protein EE612_049063 [Oryza sativa]BAT09058.1 Os09g0526800 [Oryza sativa Japonica Group]